MRTWGFALQRTAQTATIANSSQTFSVTGSHPIMWCGHCGQDVPALAGAKPGQRRCLRCDRPLHAPDEIPNQLGQPAPSDARAASDTWTDLPLRDPTWPSFDWQAEDALHDLQCTLRRVTAQPAWQVHRAHPHPPGINFAVLQRPPAISTYQAPLLGPPTTSSPWRSLVAGLSWLALSLGTTSFACGAALIGFSLYYNRPDLWDFGLPIALVGQIALLLGVALRLDRLGRDSQQAVGELERVDRQLEHLRRDAWQLAAHDAASQTFFAHQAEGANPHILLADLKSQLDALAAQVARPR